ncbi:MAG: DUF2330 domain-containing protein [Chthonomonas sp.]|nr:DUF2330 domain-containing protein [Chthonomonas sp.]
MRRFAILVSCGCVGASASACCAVGTVADDIRFANQRNIIIWDPATKTEHFIRRARFSTGESEFGFIAPTPTVPELGEAKEEAFEVGPLAINAYHAALRNAELLPRISCSKSEDLAAAGEAKGVEILQEQDVSGYRATTLRARDANAFRNWLAKHKFVTDDSIETWIQFYVKKDWVFTAFIVKGDGEAAATIPVRMSFKTDRPFAPFYVPKVNQSEAGGGLAVHFYGPGAYKSNIEGATYPLQTSSINALRLHTGVSDVPKNLALTTFGTGDFPSRTAKDDLYFDRSGDAPRWPVNYNPAKPYVAGAIVGLVAYRAIRRRRTPKI